ncbi:hypothetical protein KAR91_16945 [Candidatus Pacearchaeota archaeon]|nr:hypothetical protein [Candidatus Pacearchaeota archaeon]
MDACRFDIFNNYNKIPGKLSKIISAGSNTPEWLKNNFLNMHMKDVIYISANPYGSYLYLSKNLGHIPFYKIYELWKYDWNDSLGTVLPSKVNEAVKNSIKKHPDKRLLIHYLQPHFPFIGNKNLVLGGMKDIRNDILYNKTWDGNTIWTMFRLGKIDRNTIVNAYIRNLLLVLHYVKDLLPYLQGKVCITSDHGNVFGKFGLFYNHNSGLPLPELIEVPWFEVDLNYYS